MSTLNLLQSVLQELQIDSRNLDLEQIDDYTEASIRKHLLSHIYRLKIDEVIDSLTKKGFWNFIPPGSDEANERLMCYEHQYSHLSNQSHHKEEPVELLLQRCIILAYLMAHRGLVSPTIDQFRHEITQNQLSVQVGKLRSAIYNENRFNASILSYLGKCFGCQGSSNTPTPYDNLMALKKELIPIDVPGLVELVQKTEETKDSIRDKNIILFIGQTGSGKTTMVKSLLGYKMGKLKYKGMDWVTTVEEITDPFVLSMYSIPGSKSCTRYLTAAVPKKEVTTKDILLADSPGFGDTAGVEVEIANMVGMSESLKGCKSLLPVVVISKDSWGPRGTGIKKLAKTIACLFKDFRDCKDSVSVIINRFNEDEMAELKDQFQNILEGLNAADKADSNYVSVLEHFHELAECGELINHDVLKDNAKATMRKLLNRKSLIPAEVFGDVRPKSKPIRDYQIELEKRVRFHLTNQNLVMVKYFIDEIQQLNDVLSDELITNQIHTLKDLIEKTIQDAYNKIISTFNTKVFNLSLLREDIDTYLKEVFSLQRDSGFDKLLPDIKLIQKSIRNYRDSVLRISSEIMQERTQEEEEESKNIKNISQLHVLVESFSKDIEVQQASQSVETWLAKKLERHRANYAAQLTEGKYDKAAQELSIFRRYTRYSLLWKREAIVEENLEQMEVALLQHVKKIMQEGEDCIGFLTKRNCSILTATLQRITMYQALAEHQRPEMTVEIERRSQKFEDQIRRTSDTQFNNTMDIISRLKARCISNEQVVKFSEEFKKLKLFEGMPRIGEQAKRNLDNVRFSLERCLFEFQTTLLSQMTNSAPNTPESLKDIVNEVFAALNCINKLAEFGGEQTVRSAHAWKATMLKELEYPIRKVVNRMDNSICIMELSFSHPKAEEIIKRMEETYELEQFFSRLPDFKDDLNIQRLRSTITRNQQHITTSLEKAEVYLTRLSDKDSSLLSLHTIENALSFFSAVIRHSWVESQRNKAKEIQSNVQEQLSRLSHQTSELNRTFAKMLTEVDTDHESCQKLWNDIKKPAYILKELSNAETLFLHTRELANLEFQGFSQFTMTVEDAIDNMSRKYKELKKQSDSYPKLQKLEAKCNVFRKQDAELIGKYLLNEVTELKMEINRTTREIADKLLKKIENASGDGVLEILSRIVAWFGNSSTEFEKIVDIIDFKVGKYLLNLPNARLEDANLDRIALQYNELKVIESIPELKGEVYEGNLKLFFEKVKHISKHLTNQFCKAVDAEQLNVAFQYRHQLSVLPQDLAPESDLESNVRKVIENQERLLKALSAQRFQQFDQLKAFFDRNTSYQDQGLNKIRKKWSQRLEWITNELLRDLKASQTRKQFQVCCSKIERVLQVKYNQHSMITYKEEKLKGQKRFHNTEVLMYKKVEQLSDATIFDRHVVLPILDYIVETEDSRLSESLKQRLIRHCTNMTEGFQHLTPLCLAQELSTTPIRQFEVTVRAKDFNMRDTCLTITNSFRKTISQRLKGYSDQIKKAIDEGDANIIMKLLDKFFSATVNTENAQNVECARTFRHVYLDTVKQILNCFKESIAYFKDLSMKLSECDLQENILKCLKLLPIIEAIKNQLKGCENQLRLQLQLENILTSWSEFKGQLSERIKSCEAEVNKFIEVSDNNLHKLSSLNLKFLEKYDRAYVLLGNQSVYTEELKQKIESHSFLMDLRKLLSRNQESSNIKLSKAIKRIILETMDPLKRQEEEQSRKAQQLSTQCNQTLNALLLSILQFTLKQQSTNNEGRIRQRQQDLEDELRRKLAKKRLKTMKELNKVSLSQQSRNRHTAELQKEEYSFLAELSQGKERIRKECTVKHNALMKDKEASVLEISSRFADDLISLRKFQKEATSQSTKESSRRCISNCLANLKSCDVRWTSSLVQEMEKIDKGVFTLLVNEHPQMLNSMPTPTTQISSLGVKQIITKIPNLQPKFQQELELVCEQVSKSYKQEVQNYAENPIFAQADNLSKKIKEKAQEIRKSQNKKRLRGSGCELLAYIFAHWTISQREVNEEMPRTSQFVFVAYSLISEEMHPRIQLGILANLLTEEQRSLVLAMVSCYYALIGFDVTCIYDSEERRSKEYTHYETLFDELNVEDSVQYQLVQSVQGTFWNKQIGQAIEDNNYGSGIFTKLLKSLFTSSSKQTQSNQRLYIDSTGMQVQDSFDSSSHIRSYFKKKVECIANMANYVWKERNSITDQQLIRNQSFKACISMYPSLKSLLKSVAADMVKSVKDFKHDYEVFQGKIAYRVVNKVRYHAKEGWKTVFAYYHEASKGNIGLSPLDCMAISILGQKSAPTVQQNIEMECGKCKVAKEPEDSLRQMKTC